MKRRNQRGPTPEPTGGTRDILNLQWCRVPSKRHDAVERSCDSCRSCLPGRTTSTYSPCNQRRQPNLNEPPNTVPSPPEVRGKRWPTGRMRGAANCQPKQKNRFATALKAVSVISLLLGLWLGCSQVWREFEELGIATGRLYRPRSCVSPKSSAKAASSPARLSIRPVMC